MFRKLIYILVIYLFNEIIFRDVEGVMDNDLYSKPNLSNELIPQKWNEWCGRRYIPIKIKFFKNCFVKSYKDQFVEHSVLSNRPLIRVLGGRDVKFRESPWTVQIMKVKGSSDLDLCTGVLITMQHILTAAHCWKEGLKFRIFAGSDETKSGWNTYIDNDDFHPHENYLQIFPNGTVIKKREYDIAIIKLIKPIDWDRYGKSEDNPQFIINTICLPQFEGSTDSNPWRKATFFGWGRKTGNEKATHLQRLDLDVIYDEQKENKLFVSWEPGSCGGDSGSGLIQYLDHTEERAVLIGIVYGGIGDNRNCDPNKLINTKAVRVALHLDWIDKWLRKDPKAN